MMAELFGRVDGYSGGRSGSMHLADPSVGILGANAIVGAGIPIAVGAAIAAKVRKTGAVSVAFFGEGAAGEGVFHESLNLAALWQLPIVFVCENNSYAEMTHVSLHLAASSVAAYAKPHGIESMTIDGNDAWLVRSAAADAVTRARTASSPSLLECITYRWRGHFEGDPQAYRSRDEVAEWRRQDPLIRLRQRYGQASGDDTLLDEIDATGNAEVAAAITWAEERRKPGVEELTANVYKDPLHT
jgi:TPP-dependent pyruvate/acetoin dehydrogenase alpha subunit